MDEKESMLQLEILVTDTLHEFGVPAHLKGYMYLRYAIMLLAGNMELAHCITNGLYVEIAKEYNCTIHTVERTIRTTLEKTWENGNRAAFRKYFGYSSDNGRSRPSSSEYMILLADCIRLKLKEASVL